MEHLADTNFRRLPNGSMDIDYYVKKGHVERSLAAHKSIQNAVGFFIRIKNTLSTRLGKKDESPLFWCVKQ